MNFDFLSEIEFNNDYKESFIANALSAEKNAKYNPYQSIVASRSALECLLKGILKENGYTKINILNEMINKCLEKGYLCNDYQANATEIKNQGNKVVHANPTETMHKVTEENIKKAIEILKSLFEVCKAYFDFKGQFDEDIIPFNDYFIKSKVKKMEGEVICGEYNYFVYEEDGDEYYLQCFPLGTDEEALKLVERSEESRVTINDFLFRKTYLLQIKNIELYKGSDRRIVVYSVPKNSFLLSELKGRLNREKTLSIGLDLINSLLEMKSAGVHHRNINPGCVILSPCVNKNYLAALVNMQMTKVMDSEGTIIYQLTDRQKNNPFIPADIRRMSAEDLLDISWEKVDVYSVAKIILYCINPDLTDSNCSTSKALMELETLDFSDDFVDFFENILDNDTVNNPSLEEMKEIFENELKY